MTLKISFFKPIIFFFSTSWVFSASASCCRTGAAIASMGELISIDVNSVRLPPSAATTRIRFPSRSSRRCLHSVPFFPAGQEQHKVILPESSCSSVAVYTLPLSPASETDTDFLVMSFHLESKSARNRPGSWCVFHRPQSRPRACIFETSLRRGRAVLFCPLAALALPQRS